MSESYLFTASKSSEQDSIVWAANHISPANTLNFSNASLAESLNDTYVTAIEGNDTQYLSVLESPSEDTLEQLNITLSNSKIVDNDVNLSIEQTTDLGVSVMGETSEENQVVVFTVDGSDELYGLQLVQDNDGNLKKYQFQFRQKEDGQLEPIPETIQLVNEDDIVLEQEQEFISIDELAGTNQELQEEVVDNTILQTEEVVDNEQNDSVWIKGEIAENVVHEEEEISNGDEQFQEEVGNQNGDLDLDIKPVVLEVHQKTGNVKSELLLEEQHENENGCNQDDQEFQAVYEEVASEESNQVICGEVFYAENAVFQQEMVDGEALSADRTEEAGLVEEDHAFYENNLEEVRTYDSIKFSDNQMVLETQYVPEIQEENEETDSDGDSEYQTYENIYIQNIDEEHAEEINRDDEVGVEEEENNENEEYQVVEGVHITAEEQILDNSYTNTTMDSTTPTTVLKQPVIENGDSNVLKQQTVLEPAKMAKKSKRLLCFLVQHGEKENVHSIASMVPRNYNNNPRSVLRQSLVDGTAKTITYRTSLDKTKQHILEEAKLDRRFAKNKDAIQAKLFNNFLSKTTIPHAPVRQKRLPRKQEIKPVDTRREEEIIVQEVMISSKGFVENVEDRLKGRDKLEVVGYIDVSDSEDETRKTNKKSNNDGVIEILSSEEENEVQENSNKQLTPKKRRGRRKKNADIPQTPEKNDKNGEENTEVHDSADESSPSKKTRTGPSEQEEESDAEAPKKEHTCPLCPKTFPSANSLSTHIQHHSLENKMMKSRPSTFEFKHKCLECETTFKNTVMLNRHICPKKNKKMTQSNQCDVCKKKFDSQISLNLHKKVHDANFVKPSAISRRLTTTRNSDDTGKDTFKKNAKNKPTDGATEKNAPTDGAVGNKKPLGGAGSSKIPLGGAVGTKKPPSGAGGNKKPPLGGATSARSSSRQSVLPPKRQSTFRTSQIDANDKYTCDKCAQSFKNAILLKKHVCNATAKTHHQCPICETYFKDVTVLNMHKKKHAKEHLIKSTSEVTISPMKFLPADQRGVKPSPRKLSQLKASNKGSPSFKILNKYTCTSCGVKFSSRVLLDIHIRKQCVKTPLKKTKNNITIMHTTPLDMHAQCDLCPKKFKTYKVLLRHQITEHKLSPPNKEELMKPKKTGLVKSRAHTGIPANPRLQKSFAGLMNKLRSVTPRKPDYNSEEV